MAPLVEDEAPRGIHFSREIRTGDLLTALMIALGGLGMWFKTDARIGRLEEVAVEQKGVNAELKSAIKEGRDELRGDIKEVGNAVRRLESRVGRGRE